MLASLNDYDQQQVMKEIDYVTRYPSSTYSTKLCLNPFRRIYRTRYPFRSDHYLLEYKTNGAGQVVIDDIYFDRNVLGTKSNIANECTTLCNVSRESIGNYTGPAPSDGIKTLSGARVIIPFLMDVRNGRLCY